MPVRRDPPPTHLLRAFSVLARTRSFRRTAAEVGLTQSAVSQRIAGLESRLGVQLFDREANDLTAAGRAYLEIVIPVLNQLISAEERLTRDWSASHKRVVRLSVVPSYARCWLIPRLAALTQNLGEISLEVHTTDARVSLDDGEFDLAIRLQSNGSISGERMTREEDVLVTVASPAVVKIGQPDPFAGTVLLDDDCSRLGIAPGQSWREWYAATGHKRLPNDRMVQCSDAGLIVDAARSGAGAALVRRSLVQDDLAAGHLVQVGGPVASVGQTFLLQRPQPKRSKAAISVARWLSEAAFRGQAPQPRALPG